MSTDLRTVCTQVLLWVGGCKHAENLVSKNGSTGHYCSVSLNTTPKYICNAWITASIVNYLL